MFQDVYTGSIRVPKAAELVAARIRKAIVLANCSPATIFLRKPS